MGAEYIEMPQEGWTSQTQHLSLSLGSYRLLSVNERNLYHF